jgi:fructan beta-fructosidase
MHRLAAIFVALTTSALAQTEPFRPAFHFTPEKNWMNDPNGMVFFEDEWHLFYQYNPHGNTWGHMSWGHAVSRDLVRWEHLPLALAEEDGIMIFSGSAVVDWKNTSGFGKGDRPPLVAIYTGHREGRQDQRLAFSNDRGRTWTKFADNPVLDIKMADFRDPKVFWHEATSRWVMVVALAAEKKVHFYASPNLKQWKYSGEFGPAGATAGLWECPDLFPLNVEDVQGRDDPIQNQKWVLVVNINPGGPTGGSGTQYFVGEFDGTRFTAEPARPGGEDALWADFGADFYAGVSWSDVPKEDGRRIWLGWMSNWQYAENVPTSPWRSAMSVPRELKLRRTADGLRLVQQPANELQTLRKNAPQKFPGGSFVEAAEWLSTISDLPILLDVEMTFGRVSKDSVTGIQIDTGKDETTSVTVDARRDRLVIDRTHSGQTGFHPAFAAKHEGPLRIIDGPVTLRLLIDRSSLELFAQNGETVMSELIFPQAGPRKLRLTVEGKPPTVQNITIHRLE